MNGGRAATGGATRIQPWIVLLILQAVVASLALWPFISGQRYFAYLDIASDTYNNATAFSQDLARLFGREGWTGWTFQIGLGAPITFNFIDTIRLLTQVGGAEHVLDLRIWVYLLRIALGGAFFLLLARQFAARKEAALVAALCYSFCGYIVVNGVWDSEASAFVFFPLVLWSLVRFLRQGDQVSFPLAVGAALLSGVFFVTLAVSLFVAFLASLALAQEPRAMLRPWLTRLAPLAVLGFVIGAPIVLPLALQLLDSPRVAGGGAVLQRLQQALEPSDLKMLSLQVAALFHKDLLGSGNDYFGYMNYLEGPGFYAGLLWLVLIPQLWRGGAHDRRALVVGLAGCALYMLLPVFRLAGYGFAVPYFRVTTLWIPLALLLLGVRALDLALDRVDLRLLAAGLGASFLLLAAGSIPNWGLLWPPHLLQVIVALFAWAAVFAIAGKRRLPASRLASLVLMLALVESVAFAWPSYLAGRKTVNPAAQPFNDVTLPALRAIRGADPGIFRVEKTFASATQDDSAAQDYMGVRSYYYHGRSVVEFHQALGMVPNFGKFQPPNYTNWLEGPGDHIVLNSLLGVKYVISKSPLDWPGFEPAHQGPGWFAYRNAFALPLGFVQSRWMSRADWELPGETGPRRQALRELALLHAAVLDAPQVEAGARFDIRTLSSQPNIDLRTAYAERAQALQQSGLRIETFENDRITGTVSPREAGILVFSIPAYSGWSLRVDGQPVPLMRADAGLLAAPVSAGQHRIELEYAMPGLRSGLLLGIAGLLAVLALRLRERNSRRP
ncbi:YfhO family protein [Ramlibacter humi]|nr:YfhO family protein [Ramlibacter humi]